MGGKSKLNVTPKATENKEKKALKMQVVPAAAEEEVALPPQQEEHPQALSESLFDQDSSLPAYLWLLVFSVMMFTFPFVTFYGVRTWLQESFDFTAFQVNCFSVLSAVVVVNAIICLYVYKAFGEVEGRQEAPAAEQIAASEQAQKKEK